MRPKFDDRGDVSETTRSDSDASPTCSLVPATSSVSTAVQPSDKGLESAHAGRPGKDRGADVLSAMKRPPPLQLTATHLGDVRGEYWLLESEGEALRAALPSGCCLILSYSDRSRGPPERPSRGQTDTPSVTPQSGKRSTASCKRGVAELEHNAKIRPKLEEAKDTRRVSERTRNQAAAKRKEEVEVRPVEARSVEKPKAKAKQVAQVKAQQLPEVRPKKASTPKAKAVKKGSEKTVEKIVERSAERSDEPPRKKKELESDLDQRRPAAVGPSAPVTPTKQATAAATGAISTTAGTPGACQLLSQEEKIDLQSKIDLLDESQLERVLAFLSSDVSEDAGDQEVQLDLDLMPATRQRAFVELVEDMLRGCAVPAEAEVASAQAFGHVVSPGVPEAATPQATPDAACHAKQQRVWEEHSAREMQRQSHLREFRAQGSASASTTPVKVVEPVRPIAPASLQSSQAAPEVHPDSMLGSTESVLNMVDFGWM